MRVPDDQRAVSSGAALLRLEERCLTPPAGAYTSKTMAYNFRGQVTTEQQCVLQYCTGTTLGYSYDNAGNLTNFSVPGAASAYSVQNTYGQVGWLNNVSYGPAGSPPSQPLSSVSSFSPTGAVAGATVGAHVAITKTYDKDLRTSGLEADAQ